MKIKTTSTYLTPSCFRTDKLLPDQELLILQLENDKRFEKSVLKIRKNFDIPLEGWPEKTMGVDFLKTIISKFRNKTSVVANDEHYRNKISSEGMDDMRLLTNYAEELCIQFHLSEYWIQSVLCYISFGVLYLLPTTSDPLYWSDDRKIIDSIKNGQRVTIMIDEKMTKRQLHEWIDREWKKGLEEELDKLPPSIQSDIVQIKVYKRIEELKKQGLSASTIADKLRDEKLGDYGYEAIEPMFNRYKQYLSRRMA